MEYIIQSQNLYLRYYYAVDDEYKEYPVDIWEKNKDMATVFSSLTKAHEVANEHKAFVYPILNVVCQDDSRRFRS